MVRFMMQAISVPQFAIIEATIPQSGICLDTRLTFQVSDEVKGVACEVTFRFEAEDKVLLIMAVRCEFAIHPDDWRQLACKDTAAIPTELMEILAVHTIGTSRGILYCKTESTPFTQLMIPPLNVRQILSASPDEK